MKYKIPIGADYVPISVGSVNEHPPELVLGKFQKTEKEVIYEFEECLASDHVDYKRYDLSRVLEKLSSYGHAHGGGYYIFQLPTNDKNVSWIIIHSTWVERV